MDRNSRGCVVSEPSCLVHRLLSDKGPSKDCFLAACVTCRLPLLLCLVTSAGLFFFCVRPACLRLTRHEALILAAREEASIFSMKSMTFMGRPAYLLLSLYFIPCCCIAAALLRTGMVVDLPAPLFLLFFSSREMIPAFWPSSIPFPFPPKSIHSPPSHHVTHTTRPGSCILAPLPRKRHNSKKRLSLSRPATYCIPLHMKQPRQYCVSRAYRVWPKKGARQYSYCVPRRAFVLLLNRQQTMPVPENREYRIHNTENKTESKTESKGKITDTCT